MVENCHKILNKKILGKNLNYLNGLYLDFEFLTLVESAFQIAIYSNRRFSKRGSSLKNYKYIDIYKK